MGWIKEGGANRRKNNNTAIQLKSGIHRNTDFVRGEMHLSQHRPPSQLIREIATSTKSAVGVQVKKKKRPAASSTK